MIKVVNGKYKYYDKNGIEITDGCMIKYSDGKIKRCILLLIMNLELMQQILNGLNLVVQTLVSMEFILLEIIRQIKLK